MSSSLRATWRDMVDRCTKAHRDKHRVYFHRGIRVCERWATFANFAADMGPHPGPDWSIDRIDVNGNYEPSNCRWLLKSEQSRNTRSNRWLTVGGRTMLMRDWAVERGLHESTIHQRLARGWSEEDAVMRPTDQRRGIYASGQRSAPIRVEIDATTKTVLEWAREIGVDPTVIFGRIRRGWDPVRAVLEPIHRRSAA